MSEQSFNSVHDGEISPKEIIDFLMESWKTIAGVGVLGLLSAVVFIFVIPSQYEAIAHVRMAQIDAGNNVNPLGVDIEDVNTLITRMRSPMAYSEKEAQACKLEKSKSPAEDLIDSVLKVTAVKGSASLVELKIRRESKEVALACGQAIFENIKNSQREIMKPYVEEARNLLLQYQVRLNDVRKVIAKADKSGQALSAVYLSNRDELKFLADEMVRLSAIINAGDTRQTKLITPIYSSDKPVSPKPNMRLFLGLLAGLFLGLLYVLARKAWRNYNLNASR